MAALLATRRKHLAASCGLHARTEPVRFSAPALARLICALWQSNPPFNYARRTCEDSDTNLALLDTRRPKPGSGSQAAPAAICESVSVVDPRAHGQESQGYSYRRGKSDTPLTSDGFTPQLTRNAGELGRCVTAVR